MSQAFEAERKIRRDKALGNDDFLAILIDAEWDHRQQRKVERAMKNARFRYNAVVEQIDMDTRRGLDTTIMQRLIQLSFLQEQANILLTGPTGCGKSYIASAIGQEACLQDYRVRYFSAPKMFPWLRGLKADGSYLRELRRLDKQDLLIIDDFGLMRLNGDDELSLLDIIEDRHGRASTIITSQLPVAQWYELFQERTLADAILDRIVHSAYRLEMSGESMRKRTRTKTATSDNS